MPLRKPWKPLERATVDSVPDSYGIYELGDEAGNVVAVEAGPLRDELKEAIAYGDGSQVRWEATPNRTAAERLLEEHRERL
ncbi:DUF7508 domain-containing protein [Natronomonas marina]|jgi:hypothetical protein|uniref:DUF7508 domain-containing protein n=1 Tax=Natronomonas marina TaxID=2961939 RepID=UPI0020C9F632|nr:hypothetical protein [Natronomonas marina]